MIRNSIGVARYPVVNLSGRGLGQWQAAPTASPPVNRLLDVRTNVILSRGQLALPQRQRVTAYPSRSRLEWLQGPVPFSEWTEKEIAALTEVLAAPNEEELLDLAMIESFWNRGVQYQREASGLQQICASRQGLRSFPELFLLKSQGRENIIETIRGNSFYCPPLPEVMTPNSMYVFANNIPGFFNVNAGEYWGDIKHIVKNSLEFMSAMADYPFPSPIGVRPQVWYNHAQGGIRELVHQPVALNRDLIRFWATMSIVDSYDAVSAEVVRQLKKKAKRQKRKALIKNIALAATLGIITVGLGLALAPLIPAGAVVSSGQIAGSITSGLSQIVTMEEKKRAAEAMERVAEQFAQDEPAFAAEAEKAANFLDPQAAAAVKEMPPTQEEVEAAQEGQVESDYSPTTEGYQYTAPLPPSSGILPVVGGVAAVGALALVLSLIK